MAKYRQKLQEVEAVQFKAPKEVDVSTMFEKEFPVRIDQEGPHASLRGVRVGVGDWIVTLPNGDRIRLSDEAFKQQYESPKGG